MAGHQVLVLRIGVRVPAPQLARMADGIGIASDGACAAEPVSPDPRRRARARACARSTPKVLHDLCGRPMVLWPVRAALRGRRGQGGGRRLARRARSPRCSPEGVELAVQEQPRRHRRRGGGGDGAHSTPATGVDRTRGAGGGAQRRRAARRTRGDRGADRRAPPRGAAATMATHDARGPERLRTRRARRRRRGGAGRRDQARRATRRRPSARFARSTRASSCSPRGALGERAAAAERGQRAGRAVPAAGARRARARRRDGGGARGGRRARWCWASTTALTLARVRALAQHAIHERHMRAGVGIVDPRRDRDRRRRRDRAGHRDRAVHDDPRHAPGSARGCTVRHSYLVDCVLEDGVERRAVRLPAARDRAAHGRQGGHVRGGQELRHRRRARKSRTCPTSATRTSARGRTWARRRSRPTTTGTPSTARRSAAACARAWTRRSWRR